MVEDCSATKEDIRELRQEIDKLKSSKYLPFFGAMGLFVLIWGALWSSLRDLENDLHIAEVEIEVGNYEAIEFKGQRENNLIRHQTEHRRERERFDELVRFIQMETGVVVKIEEPEK